MTHSTHPISKRAVLLAAGLMVGATWHLQSASFSQTEPEKPKATAATEVKPNTQPLNKWISPFANSDKKKAEAEFKANLAKNGPLPAPPTQKPLATRGLLTNRFNSKATFWGHSEFKYYNNDGAPGSHFFKPSTDFSCGQAAAATILRFWKAIPDESGNGPVRRLWESYPADGYLGVAGTSWQRMQTMIQANGLQTYFIKGEDDLRYEVGNGNPVIVMLDVGKFPEWNYMWGGHWVVVHGYTKNNVYLTNWNGRSFTTWDNFRAGWINNPIVNGGGMSERGLVAKGRRGHL